MLPEIDPIGRELDPPNGARECTMTNAISATQFDPIKEARASCE